MRAPNLTAHHAAYDRLMRELLQRAARRLAAQDGPAAARPEGEITKEVHRNVGQK